MCRTIDLLKPAVVMACLFVSSHPASADDQMSRYLWQSVESLPIQAASSTPDGTQWDSWVEDTEFRWSSGDLSNLDKQTYALRFKLKNRNRRMAENEIDKLQASKLKTEFDVTRLSILRESYLDVLAIFRLKNEIDGLARQLNLARLEVETYRRLVSSRGFDSSRMQRADIERHKLKARLNLREKRLQRALRNLGLADAEKDEIHRFLDYRSWSISAPEIITTLDKGQSSDTYLRNPELRKLRLSSRIARNQTSRAKAGSDTAVRLIELEYDRDKDSFGATLGIRIPFGRNSAETSARDSAYRRARFALDNKIDSMKKRLRESRLSVLDHHDAYRVERGLLNSTRSRLKRIVDTGKPELILTLKKEENRLQTAINDRYLDMLLEYVNFVTLSGQIVDIPLRNWLQTETPLIKEY